MTASIVATVALDEQIPENSRADRYLTSVLMSAVLTTHLNGDRNWMSTDVSDVNG